METTITTSGYYHLLKCSINTTRGKRTDRPTTKNPLIALGLLKMLRYYPKRWVVFFCHQNGDHRFLWFCCHWQFMPQGVSEFEDRLMKSWSEVHLQNVAIEFMGTEMTEIYGFYMALPCMFERFGGVPNMLMDNFYSYKSSFTICISICM